MISAPTIQVGQPGRDAVRGEDNIELAGEIVPEFLNIGENKPGVDTQLVGQ